MIKQRRFFSHPVEQAKELGRAVSNLFSKKHYSALAKIAYNQITDIISTAGPVTPFSWPFLLAANKELYIRYASGGAGLYPVSGIAFTMLVSPIIADIGVKAYRTFSTQKERLESLVEASRCSASDFKELHGILTYNDFSRKEEELIASIAKEDPKKIKKFIEKEIPKLKEIDDPLTLELEKRLFLDDTSLSRRILENFQRFLPNSNKRYIELETSMLKESYSLKRYMSESYILLDSINSLSIRKRTWANMKKYGTIENFDEMIKADTNPKRRVLPEEYLHLKGMIDGCEDDYEKNRIKRKLRTYLNEGYKLVGLLKNPKVRKAAFKRYVENEYSLNYDIKKFLLVDSCDDKERVRLGLRLIEENNYNSCLEHIAIKGAKREYISAYDIAIDSGWVEKHSFSEMEEILDSIKDEETRNLAIHSISRGIRYDSLKQLKENYEDITKDENIFLMLKETLKKGSRSSTKESIEMLASLASAKKEGSEVAKIIVESFGKKKRRSFINKVAPIVAAYGGIAVSSLRDYMQKGDFSDHKTFFDMLDKEFCDMFEIEGLDPTLTIDDKVYLIGGYNRNLKVPNAKRVIAAALSGRTLMDYRVSNRIAREDCIDSLVLVSGYRARSKKAASIVIDQKEIAKANYKEAIEHLNEAGIETEQHSQFRDHASELLKTLSKHPRADENLVIDALEHLEVAANAKGYERLNFEDITYRTGDMKDFLFLGALPQRTCLNLYGINSDCLLSMIDQPNIIPLIASAKQGEIDVVLKRSILRIQGDMLVMDDVYGESEIDMVTYAAEIACTMDKELVIPEKMAKKLSDNDREYISKFGNLRKVDEHISGLIYSDSAGGRLSSSKTRYNAYVQEPCSIIMN